MNVREIQKEDLVGLWNSVIQQKGLEIQTGVQVTDVEPRTGGGFVAHTNRPRIRHAVSRSPSDGVGRPCNLGIPGEDLPDVAYALREPDVYAGDRILVVGGGDSAIEAALALAEVPATHVTISYRGQASRASNRRISGASRRPSPPKP